MQQFAVFLNLYGTTNVEYPIIFNHLLCCDQATHCSNSACLFEGYFETEQLC